MELIIDADGVHIRNGDTSRTKTTLERVSSWFGYDAARERVLAKIRHHRTMSVHCKIGTDVGRILDTLPHANYVVFECTNVDATSFPKRVMQSVFFDHCTVDAFPRVDCTSSLTFVSCTVGDDALREISGYTVSSLSLHYMSADSLIALAPIALDTITITECVDLKTSLPSVVATELSFKCPSENIEDALDALVGNQRTQALYIFIDHDRLVRSRTFAKALRTFASMPALNGLYTSDPVLQRAFIESFEILPSSTSSER
jgi:hypothetical protein